MSDYAIEKRKDHAVPGKTEDPRHLAGESASIPNSAMLNLMGSDQKNGAYRGLEDAMRSKISRVAMGQIPSAEREADTLAAGVGGGSQESVRSAMGEKLGADFSGVKFHTDSAAAGSVDSLGALAYTSGRDVYFGSDGYDAGVAAHELVHTVQQGAVEGTGVSVSAPMGAMQMKWPWSRKKKDEPAAPAAVPHRASSAVTQAPGTVNPASGFKGLKARDDRDKSHHASVAAMDAAGGARAVAKAGTSPAVERDLATFYNTAGAHREAVSGRGSSWTFDAPAARGLTEAERPGVRGLYESGTMERTRAERAYTPEEDAAATTVFSMAGGRSRAYQGSPEAREEGAIQENPADARQNADYQSTLGYTTVLDMVQGNRDRTYGLHNFDNWKEERDAGGGTIHLIDNVFDTHGASVAHGRGGRNAWLGDVMNAATNTGQSTLGTGGIVGSMRTASSSGGAGGMFDGDAAGQGVNQAISDLPAIRIAMEKKYRAASETGELSGVQQELLDRMDILPETVDPAMGPIYQELSKIGYDPKPDEDPRNAAKRAALMAQLAEARAAKEQASFGGQSHGARPSAASGPGWTRTNPSSWHASARTAPAEQTGSANPPATEAPKWKQALPTSLSAADAPASTAAPAVTEEKKKKRREFFGR